MGRILQWLRFQTITRTLEHIYPQRFVFQCSAQVLITALRLWKIQCKLPPKTKRFCPLVLK
ncbi:hypothetical protein DXK01_002270 [Bacteroides intestinalis]|nr:hypothetical protein DXK01_002270 [Bacteroides intestinalis]